MYGSDNQAPVHPAVMAAIQAANEGRAGSYGDDPWSARALALVKETFATDDLDLHLVGTGGAANGLALSALCPPWAAILAHAHAHVLADEGGGPELFTGGARLIGLAHGAPRLLPSHLETAARLHPPSFVHGPQPRAVTITNLTEHGLALDPAAVGAIAEACRRHGWRLHMDGARFANAVAATGARPADLTWRAGVDALSFGLTKVGAMAAEAVVTFGAARAPAMPYLRKRAGQLFSKQRFMAAQFIAMLEDGLWLRLAADANARARDLADRLTGEGARLVFPVEGNEVFAGLSDAHAARLVAAGVSFHPWPALGEDVRRFVTSWG
jgi:threonine aldolase